MPEITWVKVSVIAILLCLSETRIQQLAKEGVIPKQENRKYDLVGCVQGYIKYQNGLMSGQGTTSLTDERIRLTKINADQKQLNYDKAKGELLNVSIAMELWGGVVMAIKTKLLSFPVKLSPIVIACNGLAEIKKTIEEHIDEVLHELATPPDLAKIARTKYHKIDTPNIQTAPKVNRKRVVRPKKNVKRRVKR